MKIIFKMNHQIFLNEEKPEFEILAKFREFHGRFISKYSEQLKDQ